MMRYPPACVIKAACKTGHPGGGRAERAAGAAAGRAATSSCSDFVREQKVLLCIYVVTELQRFTSLLFLHTDLFFFMLQSIWSLVGGSSASVGLTAVLSGRGSAPCKCVLVTGAVTLCWVWIVTFTKDS